MKVKDLDRTQTLELIELLKKRIEFNNNLNRVVKKYMKTNYPNNTFNGFHDMATAEMQEILCNLLDTAKEWMPNNLRLDYERHCAEIFGQCYGPHVNSYVLRDLHDCERHLEEIELAANTRVEENEWFKVERDIEHNRINLRFFSIPEVEVRTLLKKNGFKYSSYYGWTRQLTKNAEESLNKIKKALNIIV